MTRLRVKWSTVLPMTLVAVTLLVYLVLIPPFQNPDEVQHFAGILGEIYPQSLHPHLETQIIHVLWETRWFVFVGMAQPDRPPEKLNQITFLTPVMGSFAINRGGLNFFHLCYAWILRPFKGTSMLNLFYLARFLSLLLTLFTLTLVYRFMSGFSPTAAGPTIWLFSLVPQFMVMGTAVNYDVFAVLFGTLFFVSLFRLTERFSWWHLAGIMAGLFGSLFTKKGGWLFFILLVLGLMLGRGWMRKLRAAVWVGSASVLLFSWINYLLPGKMLPLYRYLFSGVNRLYECSSATGIAVGVRDFVSTLGKSFFAKIGWMAFELHWLWYGVFFVLVFAALFFCIAKSKNRLQWSTGIYVVLTFLVLIAAIWQWYGARGVLPQGRYLFPLWLPFIIVMVTGIHELDQRFSPKSRVWSRVYLGMLILANGAVIFGRVIPVFYLAMSSPHQGM